MIPFGGNSGSKAMPLRGIGFCCFEYSLEPSVQTRTKQQKPAQLCWLLNLRRERDCPRFARTSGDSTSKKKCRGFAPYHFSLLSLWKVNFPRSINEKCPIKGHLFFVRRERDSNPRTCDSQRFSRPPHSTALPSLRRKSKTSKPNYKEIIEKTS